MRACRHLLLVLLGLIALGGCSHPKPAAEVAKNGGLFNKFVPAAKTSVVGKTSFYVNQTDAIAVVELNRAPFAAGSFLVARDGQQNPTAVLQATRQASASGVQGVMIVSGDLAPGEEIVEPGPELARLVQQNIDAYLVAHPAPAAPATATAPDSPAPAGPTDATPTSAAVAKPPTP